EPYVIAGKRLAIALMGERRIVAELVERVFRGDIQRAVNIDQRAVEIEKDRLEFARCQQNSSSFPTEVCRDAERAVKRVAKDSADTAADTRADLRSLSLRTRVSLCTRYFRPTRHQRRKNRPPISQPRARPRYTPRRPETRCRRTSRAGFSNTPSPARR